MTLEDTRGNQGIKELDTPNCLGLFVDANG